MANSFPGSGRPRGRCRRPQQQFGQGQEKATPLDAHRHPNAPPIIAQKRSLKSMGSVGIIVDYGLQKVGIGSEYQAGHPPRNQARRPTRSHSQRTSRQIRGRSAHRPYRLSVFVPLLLLGTVSQSVVHGEIHLATASGWPEGLCISLEKPSETRFF